MVYGFLFFEGMWCGLELPGMLQSWIITGSPLQTDLVSGVEIEGGIRCLLPGGGFHLFCAEIMQGLLGLLPARCPGVAEIELDFSCRLL